MRFALVVLLGYLLGSCPWGYWLPLVFRHEDIRKVGSGNIGATNVWRTYGRWLGAPVVALDILKGFVAGLVGVLLVSHIGGIAAGAAALLGHWRPLFLRFEKGGKLVATSAGVLLGVAPWVGLTASAIWVGTFLLLRYASVASLVTALTVPFVAWAYGGPNSVIVFCVAAAIAVIYLHRANLGRLRDGTESRFRFRKTNPA